MQQPSKIQWEAIRHGEGPARVIAGPGSGKTFTIIQRIFYLIINCQIRPDNILTITYTKAAAGEMHNRYLTEAKRRKINIDTENTAHFGTIHSICYSILKERKGIRNASLISEGKRIRIMEELLKTRGFEKLCSAELAAGLLSEFSRKKNGLSFTEKDYGIPKESMVFLMDDYREFMEERGLYDFDDLILQSLFLLQKDAACRERWQKRIDYLLVDEFQDVNQVQYEVIRLLSGKKQNLFVVGDDDQAIYGFRGAMPGIMKQFASDYPEEKVFFLTENFRSGERIVSLSEDIIKDNQNRIIKKSIPCRQGGTAKGYYCETRSMEEERLLTDIRGLNWEALSESALILRTNREAALYENLLLENRIPVKRKGKMRNAFDGETAEDVRAFLRFCKEGRKRGDFLHFMNKPDRYFSSRALPSDQVSQQQMLAYYSRNEAACRRIENLFAGLALAEKLSCQQAVRCFRRQLGYETYLKNKNPDDYGKNLKILDTIQESCKKMQNGESVDAFFERMQKELACEPEKEREGITILTMHAAKGLEFRSVFLPDLNEGVLPDRNVRSAEEVEEERRLLYVAVTRAQNQLFLYYTGERNRKLTRFLQKVSLVWDRP